MKPRAISEVAGTMVLIGVVVLGMMILYTTLLSAPSDTRIPALEASMVNRSSLITIVHQGGDSIPLGTFRILVDGVDHTGDFNNSGTFPWSVGETLSYDAPSIPSTAVMIYSGTGRGERVILRMRPGVVPPQPPVPPPPPPGGGCPPGPPWYDPDWGYRKNITIDQDEVSGTLNGFPVLVSLSSDPGLSSHAQSSGNDIFFTDSEGTKLSHEIESYSGGTLVAWVRVPQLQDTADTSIFMYYGNGGAPDQQDPAGVWDTGYMGVWHLKESGSGGAGEFRDSTSNGNNGQGGSGNSGNTPSVTAGIIGNGESYSNDHWINIPDNPPSLDPTTGITLSGWLYLRTFGSSTKVDILLRKGEANPNRYQLKVDNRRATLDFMQGDGSYFGTTQLKTRTWYYIVGTWQSGQRKRIYVNGVEDGTQTFAGPLSTDTRDLYLGGRSGGDDCMNGILDEARISDSARSPQWIATEFNNQNSPSSFFSVGNEEAACS